MGASSKPSLVYVVGTTATGKSALAVEVAEACGGSVVNADSIQLYQRIQIGAAKPSARDFDRAPHYLFDIVPTGEQMTAGEYQRVAREKVMELLNKGPVFLVGGSGFYLQAFEKGMLPSPKTPPEILSELQNKLEAAGVEVLFQELVEKDPEYAKRVSENDSYRVLRALSIMRAEGRTMSEIAQQFAEEQKQNAFPVEGLKIGLSTDRAILREKVKARLLFMVNNGLRKEVEDLLGDGLREWPPLASVGYKETIQLIDGEITEDQWLQLMETATMQLAKRQRTWFQRDESIKWFDSESELAQAKQYVLSYISERR